MCALRIQPTLSNYFRRELFLLGLCVGAAALNRPAAAASAAGTQIDLLLRVAYPDSGPGAAVLVRQGGQILVRQGYGLADLQHRVPLDPDRVFRIGSITKEFTAAAILQLVAAGKLHLNDEATRYVPNFPSHGQRITIAQLLSHTSGIPNYTAEPRFRTIPTVPLTRDQIFGLIKDRPLNFAPGTDWAYCNTGYVLLGAVIEKVSGESYAAYLRDHLLGPAGLRHTAFGEAESLLAARASGYSRTATGRWVGAVNLSATQADAAGALVSDVDDLWRWEAALQAGRIVRPDLLALARTPVSLSRGGTTAPATAWAGNCRWSPDIRRRAMAAPSAGTAATRFRFRTWGSSSRFFAIATGRWPIRRTLPCGLSAWPRERPAWMAGRS